ncbi:Protein CASP [Spathaspora sp. JA1]|nr:Protein CASP [Spathaspora sp. JA1]
MSSQDGKPGPSDEPVASTPNKSSNVFGNALQTWVEIDLPSLQKKLDDQGLHLKEEQRNSLIGRKNLAAKTKEFRKLDDSDKLQEFKGLLKLYQNEIDSLTNKNKTVENYFFGIYRLLAEAPDPRPLLEMSLDSVLESKETTTLRQQVDKLNNELARKADYDQLKQRLLQNEQKAAETLSARLQAKEDEFKSLIDEKQSNWIEKEKQLQNQIKKAQKQIEELRTSNEVAERQLDNKNKHDPVSSASVLAELDIVSRDANSSKQRIFELEKRNEELRREISKSKNDIEINSIRDTYEKKVSEIEGENALLLANLNQTRRKLDDATKEHTTKVESNSREISRMMQEIKSLKARLDQSSDYEEIKHELQLLKQIEFGYEEVSKNTTEMSDIDSILVERNKALTQELAEHRSQHNDLLTKIKELETNLQASSQELSQVSSLNHKLESDLAAFQEVANTSNFNDNASLISGFSRVTRPIGGRNGSSISSGGNLRPPEDTSILPIITKQRDRFRERNTELEEELKKHHGLVNDLKRQVNSLKKDNEELYERTRYLASFNGNQQTSKTSVSKKYFNPKPNVDLENNQYQQLYESKLHPIERFRIREQEQDINNFDPENLIVNMGGRQVPFSKINKPHNVVLEPKYHKPNVNPESFPDIEPEAKQREEELAAKHSHILDPSIHKQQVDPDSFPDIEEDAKLREEKMEAARKKND